MFFVLLCFFMFCSFVGFCSDTLYIVLFRYVILFRFNKKVCTYTLLYIIDTGGRKNFLREDVSAVLRDEALSAFENIVIGFHEYKSTTLTPYNREKHHFFIYF